MDLESSESTYVSTPQYETIGKYVLLEKLAMGGMAEVFLARALGAGGISKFFAIKRILPQYADSPEFIDMFREEAKIAINLKHSNIVSIHEFGIQEQQFFLVMDYVEGRNLRQILNKMKKSKLQFSTEHIIYLIREIAAGLDHAHRCIDATTGKPLNITHRDMSPQNVMVSFDGEVKIVDFGIAKAESQVETTRAGTLKGKFGYMSPEQAEGLSVDMRTDIFSLGIVMWEILANDRLFAANNEINTLRKIRDCHIPSLRKINPNTHSDLEKIVQKALARDKNLRYQSAAALHKDLNRFLNRQYPDFSSHDFASHIKSVFADEILQSRKMLVTYAKNSLLEGAHAEESSALKDDKTVVTDTTNHTQTSSYVSTDTSLVSKTFESDETSGISIKTNTTPNSTQVTAATKATIVTNTLADSTQNPFLSPNTQSQASVPQKLSFDSPPPAFPAPMGEKFNAKYDPSSILRGGANNDMSTQKRKKIPSSSGTKTNLPVRIKRQRNPLISAGIFLSLIIVGFFSLVKFMPQEMSQSIEVTQPYLGSIYKEMGIAGKVDTASTQGRTADRTASQPAQVEPNFGPSALVSKKIIIVSEPSGAEIWINGEKTGQITPSRLSIPTQAFKLQLSRRGFGKIEQNIDPEQVERKLSFALKKLSQGYVDIEIKPLQEVTLIIDGDKVDAESFPIRNFPIPADQNVVVKVVGSNGKSKQTNIKLKANEKQVLDFNLGMPSTRAPSNR